MYISNLTQQIAKSGKKFAKSGNLQIGFKKKDALQTYTIHKAFLIFNKRIPFIYMLHSGSKVFD